MARWKPLLRDLDSPFELREKSKKAAQPKGNAAPVNPDSFIEPLILEAAKLVQAGDVDRSVASLDKDRVIVGEPAKRMIEIGWVPPLNMTRLAASFLLSQHKMPEYQHNRIHGNGDDAGQNGS